MARNVDFIRSQDTIKFQVAETPMHTHEKPYVAYFFNPCKLQITTTKGETKVKDIPAGKVVFSKGVSHEVKVLGNRDLHTLHIQFK